MLDDYEDLAHIINSSYKSSPSPLMGEGLPGGVCFTTPRGEGEGEIKDKIPLPFTLLDKVLYSALLFKKCPI
jgi:hypothetical protein